MKLYGQDSGENLGGIEGGEDMIETYCVKMYLLHFKVVSN